MSWRRFLGRGGRDRELVEEMEVFIEEETAENLARGMSPAEAQRLARIKLGNPLAVRESLWQQNSLILIEGLWRDLRYGVRTLRRTPGFAAIAIVVMALGIGANVALFTMVRSVLLRPLPFRDPDRLMRIDEEHHGANTGGMFAEWKGRNHSFSDMAIFGYAGYNLSGAGEQLPENVRAGTFSWNALTLLGVRPALGRGFTADEDMPSANPTVLLSWGLWKRRFGGNPGIVNQTIFLDARAYTVVGVMPAWFAYPNTAVQLWTPTYFKERTGVMRALDDHEFGVIGRLGDGVTPAQGLADLSLIARRVHDQHPDTAYVAKSASGNRCWNRWWAM